MKACLCLFVSNGDPKAMLVELGKQLHAVDPNLVVYASTLEDLLTSTPTFVITRLSAIFASIIGGLGLVLACVGIYGTVSYAVARRTREVGIRMALGARKGDVLRMIVFESGRPVMLGLIIGRCRSRRRISPASVASLRPRHTRPGFLLGCRISVPVDCASCRLLARPASRACRSDGRPCAAIDWPARRLSRPKRWVGPI